MAVLDGNQGKVTLLGKEEMVSHPGYTKEGILYVLQCKKCHKEGRREFT